MAATLLEALVVEFKMAGELSWSSVYSQRQFSSPFGSIALPALRVTTLRVERVWVRYGMAPRNFTMMTLRV